MIFKKAITNLRVVRKGLAIYLLLMVTFILPVISSDSASISKIESIFPLYLPSADTPTFNLSYTTRTYLIETPVKSGDVIAGDHVTLKAEWTTTLVNRSRLEVHAPAIPASLSIERNQSTLVLDTRSLGNNGTCIIIAKAWLTNGSTLSFEFTDVYIGNYFIPKVTVLSPNGNETWMSIHNITWTASDRNLDDTLLYDVFYSTDSGFSFTPLISATNLTWFEWDCSSLNKMDTYLVRVRVTDGIYFSIDHSDSTFTAGTVITTTTSPTTTPTTPTPDLELRIVIFIAILLFSSGVMALVVYYAARRWF